MTKIEKTKLKNSIKNKPKEIMIKYNINIVYYYNINLLSSLNNKESYKQMNSKQMLEFLFQGIIFTEENPNKKFKTNIQLETS